MDKTKTFRTVEIIAYVALVVLAALVLFLSTRIPPEDPIQSWLENIAIALFGAVLVKIIASIIFRIYQQHTNEVIQQISITTIWEKLGILEMAMNWGKFREESAKGKELRDCLGHLYQDSTWYIVTINPEGFFSDGFFENVIHPAMRNGVKIKWLYVQLPEKNVSAGRTLRNWWAIQYAMAEADVDEKLRYARTNLKNKLDELIREIQQISKTGVVPNVELYECNIPITFLALLATSDKKKSGVALVHPYTIAPSTTDGQWGMILTEPGELYEQYKSSIIYLFDNGEAQGYLRRIELETQTNLRQTKPYNNANQADA
ncbi:MAG: hypothetical protein BroJett011_61000 [Chloroflexota bacterium]|nr:MAG: hypothetical protein BroJett011_61000 [Chloroflexota bacterium]